MTVHGKHDFNDSLIQLLYGPSLDTQFALERLLKDCSTTAETVEKFVQKHPEIKHLRSLSFEGWQLPDERHDRLIQLCPEIDDIALFACDASRRDFQPIIKWMQNCERIRSLSLPFPDTCRSQFIGLTQITVLNIHDWKASHSRDVYANLINSMPNLTALDCQPREDLECLTLIENPTQIQSLRLPYASDTCSRVVLNRFSQLESLDLTHNKPEALSNEILQSLNLPCIQALNLSSNDQLTHQGLASLKRFSHLTILDLCCCKNVEDKTLRRLLQHLQFSHLSLTGCPKITDRGLSHLASQAHLFSLSFGGGEEIHDMSFMQHLSELKTLFIEHSQLDGAPESLPMLVHLQKLALLAIWDAPHINDTALETLSGMTHLTNFQLSGSSITSEGEKIVNQLTVKEVTWIG